MKAAICFLALQQQKQHLLLLLLLVLHLLLHLLLQLLLLGAAAVLQHVGQSHRGPLMLLLLLVLRLMLQFLLPLFQARGNVLCFQQLLVRAVHLLLLLLLLLLPRPVSPLQAAALLQTWLVELLQFACAAAPQQ